MTRSAEQALRKFRVERRVGRYLANPLVSALGRIGISTTPATELQTTGAAFRTLASSPISVRITFTDGAA